MKALTRLSLLLIGLATGQMSLAEIYKYRDQNGRWHYTDKKPAGKKNIEVVKLRGASSTRAAGTLRRDDWVKLEEQFNRRFRPTTAAQQASFAVVSVRAANSSGSGFFVSDSGHIVTNRHVIRPENSASWRQQGENLERQQREIERRFRNLEIEKTNLEAHKTRLARMYDSVRHPGRYANPLTAEQYRTYEQQYKERERTYRESYRQLQQYSREFKGRKREFDFSSNTGSVSRSFKVYLKDNTEVRAHLLRISKKYDLALLKIDGYITPYLPPTRSPGPSQTQQVFAIGSPLGHRDSITEGKVTGLQGGNILIDATILSGNSGGPLVDDQGQLLGVNTWRVTDKRFSGNNNGFGKAIPAYVVLEEFGSLINAGK